MELKNLIGELSEKLNLDREIKIIVKPFKRKIASISHKTGTLYLNQLCLEILTEEEIKFVLAHELLHLKHGKYHTVKFEQELKKLFKIDLTETIELKLIQKLLEKKSGKITQRG